MNKNEILEITNKFLPDTPVIIHVSEGINYKAIIQRVLEKDSFIFIKETVPFGKQFVIPVSDIIMIEEDKNVGERIYIEGNA